MAYHHAPSMLSRDSSETEMEQLNPPDHGPLQHLTRRQYGPPSYGDQSSSQSLRSGVAIDRPLRRHYSWCLLLLLYVAILAVPWVLTCILNFKPFLLPSYSDKSTFKLSDFGNGQGALQAIRALNAVAALMTVPVLSFILAYGAVVYAQRRNQSQKLSLQQTFTLADRGWSNILTFIGTLHPNNHKGSSYLYLGFVLIFIGKQNLFATPRRDSTFNRSSPSTSTGTAGLH